ncbi:MAG: acetoacetate--CoA ligase [Alphaproteobacteria bacterium]|nr:acetoacetate--CoA ligase [Alphaproteobacteria bacterium]
MTHTPSQQHSKSSDTPLWSPKAPHDSLLFAFKARMEKQTGRTFPDYESLWNWSIENRSDFWSAVWDFCGIIGDKGEAILENPDAMPGARFFPESRLNYAENLLGERSNDRALIFRNERQEEWTLTRAELHDKVSLWQQAFKAAGIEKGDRIAGYVPNFPEAIIAMLAASSLGAVWSSASPDFGAQGVIDRFGQIEPKILISVDGYYYNGKTVDCLSKIKAIQPALTSLEKTIIVPFLDGIPDISGLQDTVTSDVFTEAFDPHPVTFERLPFDHPLYIMFSSGTTGVPKCIVHGAGGTLIQHMKEHKLQCDIRPGDRVFYFTTCGWMMWNWLVSALASEATLLLYDGSPFYPDGNILWGYAEKHRCTFFGTSAKYIDALKTNGLKPGDNHDLSSIRAIASTGSPLVHESFDYAYDAIKKDVQLASISGGTDIISCFMLGNPLSPVWRGEIQGPGLGMAISILAENGQDVQGQPGELVCTKPFPSMPVGFWNDEDGLKYKSAYFEERPGLWTHGDWVEKTSHGGFIIHGRSDATLNPGGVRIGTAEIYRQVEQLEAVAESIAVGQDWEGDVRVILFVVLKPGWELDANLVKEIKTKIRTGASPRHVPAKVIAVSDIPRTKSGKITELAVRDIIMGRSVKNKEALANPEALALYKDLEELRS